MIHLNTLNSEQKRAVLTTEGPVLIVAGAGAGKTKTITHRILHLMHTGVSPLRILAITFTNKAAKEMRERVSNLIREDTELSDHHTMPFVSTFHSLGVAIIKENSALLHLPRHFSIFDTTDSKKVIKDALVQIGLDPKEHTDKIRHIISQEKGRGVVLSDYAARDAYDYTSEITKKVWTLYEARMSKEHALDFDDLLLKTLKLLQQQPDILAEYQERFLYIHVDEYQDTNKIQHEIIELLARKYRNLCVVGDTDQNIYSWRGAEIKNMLNFERTYPEVHTIFLEQNYRSTKTILAAADEIIRKNTFRIPKTLFTENISGEKIGIFEARSEVDEAHFIALTSKQLIEDGIAADHIAVLYRANFQSRVLEEAFMAYTVPYQMLGTKFFERKEIKDVLSYIKAALNTEGESDFLRIVNTPARGIGKTTIQKILSGQEVDLPASARIKIHNVRMLLDDFRIALTTQKPSEALRHIIKKSGMEESYTTGLEEDTERLENIMELVTLATQYDIYDAEEGIEKFLTDSSLTSDQDALDGGKTGVKLMTVHASKGLEFEIVFVAGLEDDLFPHARRNESKKTGEDGEEERRLFYVAITRARKKLYLTWAQTRTIFGTHEVNAPSEFLSDISEEYTQKESYAGGEEPRKVLFSIDF